MERHTLFVQTTPELFQDDTLCSPSSLSCPVTGQMMKFPPNQNGDGAKTQSLSSAPPPESSSESDPSSPSEFPGLPTPPNTPLHPSSIHIRRERQTFNRLPLSDAILFTVRTYITPLTSLGDDEFAAFMDGAGRWEADIASYKGRERWWETVKVYEREKRRNSCEDGEGEGRRASKKF